MEQLERDRLVVENQKLVPYIYNKLAKNTITINYKDDIVSEGMVGLVKAANSFDPSKNTKFSTYESLCIRNEMLMYLRKLNRYVPYEISLYKPVGRDVDGSELCIGDIIVDDRYSDELAFTEIILNEFETKQKPIDRKILSGMKEGYKQKEIASILGMKQPTVSRHICKMRKEFRND